MHYFLISKTRIIIIGVKMAELDLLDCHFTRIKEATDSLASIWWLERHCSEFSDGEWIDPEALLAAKYPDLDLNCEKEILEKGTWEASALILERHYPAEFAPNKRELKTVCRNI